MANVLIFAPQVVLTLSASLLIGTPCPASCLFFGAKADTEPAFPDNSARTFIEASLLAFASTHKFTDSTATPGPKDYLRPRNSILTFGGHGSSHCESMANVLIFFAPQVCTYTPLHAKKSYNLFLVVLPCPRELCIILREFFACCCFVRAT